MTTVTNTKDPRTELVIAHYEALNLGTLEALLSLYADNACFKDPFNDVRGHRAIRGVFAHMFMTLNAPRFQILDAFTEGDQAFLSWDFTFTRARGQSPMTIHGATHLRYADDGRITLHRDYWDAAEELYAKLPVLGVLIRALQRRLRAPG